jgi:hypothetical protein
MAAEQEDSGEAERGFREEAERHVGMNPNTLGASRRWLLDLREVFGFVKENLAGAQRRRAPIARKEWGKDDTSCPRLSRQRPGARSAPNRGRPDRSTRRRNQGSIRSYGAYQQRALRENVAPDCSQQNGGHSSWRAGVRVIRFPPTVGTLNCVD